MSKRTTKRSILQGEEGIKWLIALTSLDVKNLAAGRPGDLPNLVYDLKRWLGVYDDPRLAGQIQSLSRRPSLFQSLVDEVSSLVAAVADRGKFSYRYSDGSVQVDARRLQEGGSRVVSYRFTDLRDAVVHVAVHDLTGPHAILVRRCREQTCRKIFLASRSSQIYCSHRCANLKASRNYRAVNRAKRAERERQRYRLKVLRRVGGGAIKVGRQPRA